MKPNEDPFRERVKHPMRVELLVNGLIDRWHRRVEMLIAAHTAEDGRTLFGIPLTPEEEWQRWQDPAVRAEKVKEAREMHPDNPDKAESDYVMRMAKLDAKLHTSNGSKP